MQLFDLLQSDEEDGYQMVMKKCDLDADGRMNYNEFLNAAIDLQNTLNRENIQMVFNLLDLDQDGKISIQNLKDTFSNH